MLAALAPAAEGVGERPSATVQVPAGSEPAAVSGILDREFPVRDPEQLVLAVRSGTKVLAWASRLSRGPWTGQLSNGGTMVRQHPAKDVPAMAEGASDMIERSGDPTRVASSGRRAAWAGYAACTWALVFAVVHLYWGLGGTVGLPPGLSVYDNTALFVIDLLAIPLCVLGALLALALVQPWGGRLPRWMLLSAAWGASALFVAHALPAVVDAVVIALGQRTERLTPVDRYSLFLYEPYWLLGGILFGVTAWHYTRGTRP